MTRGHHTHLLAVTIKSEFLCFLFCFYLCVVQLVWIFLSGVFFFLICGLGKVNFCLFCFICSLLGIIFPSVVFFLVFWYRCICLCGLGGKLVVGLNTLSKSNSKPNNLDFPVI